MAFDWYEVGTTVHLVGEWNDLEGERVDPATITLMLTEPDGTVTTKNKGDLTQESTGIWYWPLLTTQLRLHAFTYTAVAAITTVVKTGYFNVRELNP